MKSVLFDNMNVLFNTFKMNNLINKRTFAFMVDGHPYTTREQYVTGHEIKAQAGVPDGYLLFLTHKKAEDELIEDGRQVDLAMPGIEKFITREPSHEQQIIINDSHIDYDGESITYDQVVRLNPKGYDPAHEYSVVYFDGPYQNPTGEMEPGNVVFVKDQMRFNVTGSHSS